MFIEKEVGQASWTSYGRVQTKEQEKIFNEKPNFTLKKDYIPATSMPKYLSYLLHKI